MKRKIVKINLMSNFNKANNEDINEEVIALIHQCKGMINNLEQMNESYICEVKNFIVYFQKVFEKNFPHIHIDIPEDSINSHELILKLHNYIDTMKAHLDGVENNDIKELDAIVMKSAAKNKHQLLSLSDEDEEVDTHNLQKLIKTNKKFYEEKFQQLFLIKENGIVSQTYFSKADNTMTSLYCEAVCYFHIKERPGDVRVYIQTLRRLFNKYVILYRHDEEKSLIKVIVSGLAYKRNTKRKVVRFIMQIAKENCMIKFSNFSKFSACFEGVGNKIRRNYYFYTNIENSKLATLIE
jgi:hypothetical protein